MNDCLFEPFYSTFTISLLARPRCPTGRVIRTYSVHFQSQLYLSQSFLSGAAGLEPAMCLSLLVLETSAVASVPRTYKKTGMGVEPTTNGFADHPPSHSGFPSKMQRKVRDSNSQGASNFTVGWRIELQLRSSRRTIFKIATHANQVFPTKYVYLPSALTTQYISLRTRYVTISSGYVLSTISIVLVTCYPRRCCTQSTYRYSKSEPLTWKASVLPLELHVQFYINKMEP